VVKSPHLRSKYGWLHGDGKASSRCCPGLCDIARADPDGNVAQVLRPRVSHRMPDRTAGGGECQWEPVTFGDVDRAPPAETFLASGELDSWDPPRVLLSLIPAFTGFRHPLTRIRTGLSGDARR
jgi:hypothetical protein